MGKAVRREMSFEARFQLASHGLGAIGVSALFATGMVGATYTGLAVVSLLWSLVRGFRHSGFELEPWVANGVTLVTLTVTMTSIFFGDEAPVRSIAEFLLILTAIKGFAFKANRDWLQIYVLSFFQLLAASALTIEPVFALVFVAFLVLAPWTLVLFHLRTELEGTADAWRLAEEPFVDPSLFRSVAGMSAVLFVLTIVIFISFPRIGVGFFAPALGNTGGLTGFSDEVGLGDVTALSQNEAIAMRVTLDPADALEGDPLYFTGTILDDYDGRRWTRGSHDFRTLDRFRGVFSMGTGRDPGRLVRQDILLEPIESNAILVLGRPVEIRGPFTGIIRDGLGNLRGISAVGNGRKRYEVLSTLGQDRTPPRAEAWEIPESSDARIPEVARQVVQGIANDGDRARALLRFLGPGFRYSLEPGDPGEGDPLAYFLFESREGHCEYFASALAVMLRSVGIASRIVGGYHGGEWNGYGDYVVFRQSDAHTWVEAFVDGAWVRFDPTPVGAPREIGPLANLRAMVDAYRMRWYRYVVNYEAADQLRMAFGLRDASRRVRSALSLSALREWLRGESSEGSSRSARFGLWIVLALVAVAIGWRLRARGGPRAVRPESAAYLRALRRLERAGFARSRSETSNEFLERVEADLPEGLRCFGRLTELYQEARFSAQPDRFEARSAEIDACLREIEAAPSDAP